MARLSLVIRRHEMAAEVEEARDCRVHPEEALRLKHGFESLHAPFPHPGGLVEEFDPVVRVPRSELVAPKPNGFVGDHNAPPRQQIFDAAMAQIEPMRARWRTG